MLATSAPSCHCKILPSAVTDVDGITLAGVLSYQTFAQLAKVAPIACRYSLVLVQREAAKNDLMLVAYDIEGAEAAAEAASGDRRMLELRQQVWDAECELNKAQAEGPANHRKRDFLDKVKSVVCSQPGLACTTLPAACFLSFISELSATSSKSVCCFDGRWLPRNCFAVEEGSIVVIELVL